MDRLTSKIWQNVLFGFWGLWGVWLLWVGMRDLFTDPRSDLRIQFATGALQILMAVQFFRGGAREERRWMWRLWGFVALSDIALTFAAARPWRGDYWMDWVLTAVVIALALVSLRWLFGRRQALAGGSSSGATGA